MHEGRTLFAQLMERLPWKSFGRIVERHGGDWRARRLSCAEQLRCMAFAQLTYRESLRDIEACLTAQRGKLYHMGLRQPVRRTTLAEANERRPWRIYAELAQLLIARARRLYADEPFGMQLDHTAYALDTTNIDLCLSVFPWAPFRRTKGALRLHTLLDLRGSIPSFVHISDGKWHEVQVLDLIAPEPGAFYVMDRGFLDFARLHRLDQAGAFFVIRARRDLDARCVAWLSAHGAPSGPRDQIITLAGVRSRHYYPDQLRRIDYRDADSGKTLVFLTNHFDLPALTVSQLYRQRWQVELFFKWIKQHLRIKRFYGTSENAVKTQIWIAVTVYLLVAIVRKELRLKISLHSLLQILSLTMFEKIPLPQAIADSGPSQHLSAPTDQLTLFES